VHEPTGPPQSARPQRFLAGVVGRVPPGWQLPLAVYVVCQAIFLFWWAAFYPGLMSYDSIIYVIHVTTGPWVDNHSVLYDALVWLSLHATGGLGGLTLAQTAVMSVALAYTVVAFRRLGVPGRWTAVAAVALAALPPTGTFIVFVWKDVAFSICTYLVVPTVAHLLSLRGAAGWRADRRVNRLIAALGLELLGVCLFRPNGFVVVVIAAVVLLVLVPRVRARLAAAAVAAVCLAFALNLFVYPGAGIQRAPTSLALGPAYADIAVAYAARPSSFTTADRALMTRVAPLSEWTTTANCLSADSTTRIPGFNANASKVSGQLFSLWLRVLGRSPDLILGARICRGSIAWSIFPNSAAGSAGYLASSVVPSSLFGLASTKSVRNSPYRAGLATRPLLGPVNKLAVFLRSVAQLPQLQWLLWRGAFWCYVSYLAVWVLARRRHNWPLLSLAAIVVGQQLAIIIDNPSQLFRYMASPILIGIMLLPLFFARKPVLPA
jgi:hypothetical protein